MSKQYHIYGIGAALVDTEISVTDQDLAAMAVDKGVMTLVDQERQEALKSYLQNANIQALLASGGSAANTIIAANYFGCRNFYSCKVANDENGRFYLADLNAAGVTTAQDRNNLPEGTTGKCLVMITPDAERTMNTHLGISETVSIDNLQLDVVAHAEYVYLEGYLVSSTTGRAAAIALRKAAEKEGTRTALSLSDPAMVQFFRDGLIDMIGDGVDLLFCNSDEAIHFTSSNTLTEAIEKLKAFAKTFAITCGSEGALLFDGLELLKVEAHPITPVDTNGAGDMFAGAFLYGITHGYSFQQAGDFASLAAAKVVSQYGPRLRAEQHEELLKAL